MSQPIKSYNVGVISIAVFESFVTTCDTERGDRLDPAATVMKNKPMTVPLPH